MITLLEYFVMQPLEPLMGRLVMGLSYLGWYNLFFVGSVGGPKISSAKEAEARAILSAIHIARSHGFSAAHFASDSLKVIQAIKGGLEWSLATIVYGILGYVKYFSSVGFFHVSNTLKRIAHDCARRFHGLLLSEIHFVAPS